MKKTTIVISFCFLLLAELSFAQKRDVIFFMAPEYKGTEENIKSIAVFTEIFYTVFSNQLRATFPCATDIDLGSIHDMLDVERQRQLLGSGSDEALKSIAEAYNVDYLVKLKLSAIENTFLVSVVCLPYRAKDKLAEARALASCPFNGSPTEEMQNKVKEVANSIIEQLKEEEICPFKGPVTITNETTRDTIKEYQYDVYCNETDQQFHIKTEVHDYTYSKWELSRRGNERANGDMTFRTNEKTTIIEEDGCYKCSSGRQGGRTLTEEHSLKLSGGGISHESQWNGMPQEDTRIELEFLDNGTYLVIAKGTSLPAKGDEFVYFHAEGTCDNKNENNAKPRVVRIPLKAVFGPYPGKPIDKILQQKETTKTKDPVTKEVHTYTIDFNLKHD